MAQARIISTTAEDVSAVDLARGEPPPKRIRNFDITDVTTTGPGFNKFFSRYLAIANQDARRPAPLITRWPIG